MNEPAQELAREQEPRGELVLRRRGEVTELVVNGVFAMDSAHVDSEVALADLALAEVGPRPPRPQPLGQPPEPAGSQRHLRVLVAGLGLGFTARAVLADPRVVRLEVVELHACLIRWVRAGLVPAAASLLDDDRVTVRCDDILDVLAELAPASLDVILLDVDNGPDFLVHNENAALYEPGPLAAAWSALRPGGVLAVWSAGASPTLRERLRAVAGHCREVLLAAPRAGRVMDYAIYLVRRPATEPVPRQSIPSA